MSRTAPEDLGFAHVYRAASQPDAPTLLLLHGTGGDEHDMLPLGGLLPGANLLSPRGRVLEHGMPRFFRRLAEGVFDVDDVKRRAHELADFVTAAAEHYGFDRSRVTALGFSNGANIAAAMLLLRPEALSGAVLLRPMSPFARAPAADLAGKPVLIVSGGFDPIVPEENAARLADTLRGAGASLVHRTLPTGHGLSQADLGLVRDWLAGARAKAA
jgi:phospholipase/carboxylesterase